jgi:hypothetical protein
MTLGDTNVVFTFNPMVAPNNAAGSSGDVDGMADNPMAQALFHSTHGRRTWNSVAWAV